ncbi:MAG TPA: hypothetical protein VEC19_11185 [Usitatibacter sp.]|nr:hypothetical protein [Usitatibacter sp.]
MANPEEGKGAFYRYYWIKISTEAQMAAFRARMLDPSAPKNLTVGPDNGIHPPPLRQYSAVDSAYMPMNPITPPLKLADSDVVPLDRNATPDASHLARITMGFIVSPEYANAKGMMLERRPMRPGMGLLEAQKWIDDGEGKEWAGDSFCVLAYVAVTTE